MRKRLKYLLLLPLTGIISCGYSTSYLVEGNKYVSANFKENYYTRWDSELSSASKEAIKDVSEEAYLYKYHYNEFATLEGFGEIDPNYFSNDPVMEDYGSQYKMNDVDDSFRYGYQSKLFDGQMVCGGQNSHPEYAYQYGRVQIKQSGFSVRFSKESSGLHYFAMQFKTSTDNTSYTLTPIPDPDRREINHDEKFFHKSQFDLNITLYTKNNEGIVGHPFKVNVDYSDEIPVGDKHTFLTNNGHYYSFLAFDLSKYSLSRLIGVSIDFEVLYDDLIEYNPTSGITYDDYALFLYEMFFPYTSWN